MQSVLVPHDPIFIADNTALEEMASLEGWSGDGSEEDPFVIENYEISVSGFLSSGIEIWNTTLFLTVRDCGISGDWQADAGILLANVTNATASENICYAFRSGGVTLVSSSECVVSNNTCISSKGVYLQESHNNSVKDNILSGSGRGVYARGSCGNVIESNTCLNCDYGVYLAVATVPNGGSTNNTLSGNDCSMCNMIGIFITRYCDNNTIDECICDENEVGIFTWGTLSTVISSNSCSRNAVGVLLYDSMHSTVCDNLFYCNDGYGVKVEVSYYNLIFNNTFADNNGAGDAYDASHIQAIDEGGLNQWNASGYGNYWSDWTEPDENLDGIVDRPYNISTLPLAKDYYPRTTQPVPIPEFSSLIMPVIGAFMVIAILAYRRRK